MQMQCNIDATITISNGRRLSRNSPTPPKPVALRRRGAFHKTIYNMAQSPRDMMMATRVVERLRNVTAATLMGYYANNGDDDDHVIMHATQFWVLQ